MGISVRQIFAMAWALAAVSALIAGVLLADLSAVEQNIAAFGLIVFPVVILGGLDSVPGTIVGGLTIGLLKQYVSGYADPGLAEVIPYVVLVAIPVSYTHLRAHETVLDLVCRLLLEKKQKEISTIQVTPSLTRILTHHETSRR